MQGRAFQSHFGCQRESHYLKHESMWMLITASWNQWIYVCNTEMKGMHTRCKSNQLFSRVKKTFLSLDDGVILVFQRGGAIKKFATAPRTRPWLRSWEIYDGCSPMRSALLNKMRKGEGAFIMALIGSLYVVLPFIMHKKMSKICKTLWQSYNLYPKNPYSYIQRKFQQACALGLPLKCNLLYFLPIFAVAEPIDAALNS